uniref:Serpentine receptor class gamma n=1 Tax=Panagrellus redivivus TaxID=6233 RepID=A0A7E4VVK0_PANRE
MTDDDFYGYASTGTKILTLFSVFVSCPLYITVLVILYRHRKTFPFNSTFFIIYIALGVVDVLPPPQYGPPPLS